ncbi:MAG: hypothetical protein ACRCXT_11240 [Paraclostridium sp.]
MIGIGFIDDLITDIGMPLVKKGVKALTGIDLESKELTAEDKQKIMDSQIEIMKIDFEKMKLEFDNTNSARDMNVEIQKSEFASNLSKNTAYYIDIALVLAVIILGFSLFIFKLPIENKELAYTMFGSLLTMAGTVINFHRGSSKGSIDKQEIINKLNYPTNNLKDK